MSPLDDELRRTLRARAAAVAPSPDPLAGIERRARRLRRRRALSAVTGAAAAAAVVALAVPAVVNGIGPAPKQLVSPSTSPAATATTAADVLDPRRPWAYRGDPALLTDGTVDALRAVWGADHPGSTLVPLVGQVWEPSGQPELAFVATQPGDTRFHIGWAAVSSTRGPEVLVDDLVGAEPAYQVALPGDEGALRLYVIAAPDTHALYAADGRTYRDITQMTVVHADGPAGYTTTQRGGIGVTAVETQDARVRVVDAEGAVIYEAAARGATAAPANLLDWPLRGSSALSPDLAGLRDAYARWRGRDDGSSVRYRPLFSGAHGSEVRLTLGQAWFPGDSAATTVSWATGLSTGEQLRTYRAAKPGTVAVVALAEDLPRSNTDLLVVVPVPTAGQVSYAAATGSFRTLDRVQDGVAYVERSPGATEDRLEILDGDGDLDHPLFRGLVDAFLCAADRTCLFPAR